MRKLIASGLAIVTLAACAPTQPRHLRDLRPTANPSAVLATEIAFARAAQERGQWTAFRQFAARDAVMFVPEPENAQDWLRRQADPPQPVRWQAHQVWSSCDGTLAVTRGAWQRPDGTQGYFTTIWQLQDDRSYKWVVDQGDTLADPLAAPEMIGAEVADCGTGQVVAGATGASLDLPARGGGASADRTLAYEWEVAGDRSRRLRVWMMDGGESVDVLAVAVGAPGG